MLLHALPGLQVRICLLQCIVSLFLCFLSLNGNTFGNGKRKYLFYTIFPIFAGFFSKCYCFLRNPYCLFQCSSVSFSDCTKYYCFVHIFLAASWFVRGVPRNLMGCLFYTPPILLLPVISTPKPWRETVTTLHPGLTVTQRELGAWFEWFMQIATFFSSFFSLSTFYIFSKLVWETLVRWSLTENAHQQYAWGLNAWAGVCCAALRTRARFIAEGPPNLAIRELLISHAFSLL